MWANNYWQSLELYKDIVDTIPEFKNLPIGQSLSVNDTDGNLLYNIITEPLPTREENLDSIVSDIVIGKPDSQITMAVREVAKFGLRSVFTVMLEALKAVDIDIEAITRGDFDLYVEDVQAGENHWFRANHLQEKIMGLASFSVDYDKDGNLIGNSINNRNRPCKQPEELLRSEEFKTKCSVLHQNIKG